MVRFTGLLALAGILGAGLGAATADKASASHATSSATAVSSTIPVESLDPEKTKEKFSEEWIYNKTQELFNRTLTKKEYYERDWMWIRCRSTGSWLFDMGGSWFGVGGEDLKKAVGKAIPCAPITWKFNYVNKRGWGDATLNMGCPIEIWTDQMVVVEEALKLVKKMSPEKHRELYIWDCHGFEQYPNYGRQWYGKPWPGKPDSSGDDKKKDDSSRDSMELASQNSGVDMGGL